MEMATKILLGIGQVSAMLLGCLRVGALLGDGSVAGLFRVHSLRLCQIRGK